MEAPFGAFLFPCDLVIVVIITRLGVVGRLGMVGGQLNEICR